jgi:plasmid maintenance system antidote protein VapI
MTKPAAHNRLSLLPERDVMMEFRREVESFSSDAKAAKAMGISRSHLSRVLSGAKPLTAKLAAFIGYEQETWYRRRR